MCARAPLDTLFAFQIRVTSRELLSAHATRKVYPVKKRQTRCPSKKKVYLRCLHATVASSFQTKTQVIWSIQMV